MAIDFLLVIFTLAAIVPLMAGVAISDLATTNPTPTAKASLLLSQSEAWEFVGLPRSTWFRLRSAGKLPNPVEVPSGGLYWLRSDLENWVNGLKYIRRSR